MARKKLALTFYYSENWIAGAYYTANIVKALNTLPDTDKPDLYVIMKNTDGINLLREISYPYLKYINTDPSGDGFMSKYLRRLTIKITKTDWILRLRLSGVYNIFEGDDQFRFIKNHFYWIHDFQECRLPDFFTPAESAARSALPKKVSKMPAATVVLSSLDALNDFNTFFAGYLCKVKTLRFASSLPEFNGIDLESESKRYGIEYPFFICSNQFWQHKNHKLVLEAINILKEKRLKFHVVFTGKNYDHRNPEYFSSLTSYTKDNELEPWVRFCGFLDRKVQICLASNSIGYIQPSLFEGWSTTVEDAKNLNKYVLLSNLPVHKEQLDYNVSFFNPRDARELAMEMESVLVNPPNIQKRNYSENVKQFGRDLIDVFCASED